MYDIIVIGGGAAGLTVAAGASSLGAKVALVEKSKLLGGDCLHFGCVPSKALISIANQVAEARKTTKFGMDVSGDINVEKVMEQVQSSIRTIQEHDDPDRFEKLGVDVLFGAASFITSTKIKVGESKTIEGKRVVVATGSSPFIPPIEGLKDIHYWTNETVFTMKQLPKRLLVIGGGAIGMELSQAFARLGSEVTLVERGKTLGKTGDKELVGKVTELLEREMTVFTSTDVEKISTTNEGKIIALRDQTTTFTLEVDEIIVAAGRKPNTRELNLDGVGVKVDERGHILIDRYGRSSIPTIFGIGDVNGQYGFTHAAGMEGKAVVQTAVLGIPSKLSYESFPWITFTDPEWFQMGLTEESAVQRFGKENINIYKSSLDEVDRFIAEHRTEGIVKMITKKDGTIIGAHALGVGAGDWMQTVVYAVQKKQKIGSLSRMIYPYPNRAGAVQKTSDLYWREKLFNGPFTKITKKYIQWFR
ncbi:dihydrolipoyl dehydrogenase family protein [Mangrovibacillus cuniculi]|uniref:FAD-dependent oxidoreductase n=1 Tax=Mangrovibacillus cuniculi TaxID=2593652 RepID=A0A7S8HGU6_9BACI|nr:FAD-dependent oxidoreductase [Mangrovibacillus cuniculi]QPC48172.1 FAD-dependent oxidoreductase [Mangrovibacillus cuniculi]